MTMLAADDIVLMRADQALSRWDTCRRLVYTAGAVNAYGMPEPPTYVRGDAITCGLDMRSSAREVMNGTQVVLADARLRLSVNTTLDNRDRIEITQRFGEVLATPLVYEIIGEPERGPSGLVVNLRLATDGQGAA
jgi:hypothetical protein